MAVLRKEKKGSFTIIDNAIFKDCTLSMKAKGLLCQMLSLPDGWNYSIAGLTKLVSDGESAVRSTLKELEEAGYFRREQIRENGKITKIEYVISEYKNCDFPHVVFPQQENPQQGFPQQENRGQLNTKELSTKESNTDSLITKKSLLSEFENLWAMYPRKNGKERAIGYYEKARRSGTTYEEVKNGIESYVRYIKAEGTEPRYIKMGSTFFSQKAWQDEWVSNKPPLDEYEQEEQDILDGIL